LRALRDERTIVEPMSEQAGSNEQLVVELSITTAPSSRRSSQEQLLSRSSQMIIPGGAAVGPLATAPRRSRQSHPSRPPPPPEPVAAESEATPQRKDSLPLPFTPYSEPSTAATAARPTVPRSNSVSTVATEPATAETEFDQVRRRMFEATQLAADAGGSGGGGGGPFSCYAALYERLPPALLACLPPPPDYAERTGAATKLQAVRRGKQTREQARAAPAQPTEASAAPAVVAAAARDKQQVAEGGGHSQPTTEVQPVSQGMDARKAVPLLPGVAAAAAAEAEAAEAVAAEAAARPKKRGFMGGLFSKGGDSSRKLSHRDNKRDAAPLKERPAASTAAQGYTHAHRTTGSPFRGSGALMATQPVAAPRDMYGRPIDHTSHVNKSKLVYSGSWAPSKFVRGVSPPRWLDRDVDRAMGITEQVKEVRL